MGSKMMISIVAAALAGGPAAAAAQDWARAADSSLEENVGLGAGAVAGAVLGGPPGLILGAGVGLLMGRQARLDSELAQANAALAEAGRRPAAVALHGRDPGPVGPTVGAASPADSDLRAVAAGLALSVPFRTASHVLEPHLAAQLDALARTLVAVPALRVSLDAYADTRGGVRFNRVLSRRRAEAVRAVLLAAGVAPARIDARAHGEDGALYPNGDRDGYPFDRRVVVTLRLGGDL